jgi:hypothetical protein
VSPKIEIGDLTECSTIEGFVKDALESVRARPLTDKCAIVTTFRARAEAVYKALKPLERERVAVWVSPPVGEAYRWPLH